MLDAGCVELVDFPVELFGGSVYPMEALKRAGVDMENPKVIRAVMDRFRSILGEMEEILLEE